MKRNTNHVRRGLATSNAKRDSNYRTPLAEIATPFPIAVNAGCGFIAVIVGTPSSDPSPAMPPQRPPMHLMADPKLPLRGRKPKSGDPAHASASALASHGASEPGQATACDPESGQLYTYNADRGVWKPLGKPTRGGNSGAIAHADFKHKGNLINVANGMLRIANNGKVTKLPFSPSYFSRNQSPVKWVPNAQCPKFLSAIRSVLPQEDILALQMYCGQCLLGKNLTQTMLLLRGPTGLLKSTVLQILRLLLGADNVQTLRTDHLDGRFELDRFVGKQLLVAPDVGADFLAKKPVGALKRLTGGDWLDTERKGSNDGRAITGDFNICISSNAHMTIRLEGDRDAYERRLLMLEFRGQQPKRTVHDYAAELVGEEGPGIMRWAVEGAAALLRSIKKTGHFPRSAAQRARVKDMLDRSDSVATFATLCVRHDNHANATTEELHLAYDEFCGSMGWSSVDRKEFEDKFGAAMAARPGILRTNGLLRNGKRASGYRNARVLLPVQPAAGPTKEEAS